MKESKFDILFESVMNELNNVHNSIVRIFNWNESTQSFSDLYSEEINFKFKNITQDKFEMLKDLTYDLEQCEEHNLEDDVYKKVEITDKELIKLIQESITDKKLKNYSSSILLAVSGYYNVDLGNGVSFMFDNYDKDGYVMLNNNGNQFLTARNWPFGSAISISLIIVTFILVGIYKKTGGKIRR